MNRTDEWENMEHEFVKKIIVCVVAVVVFWTVINVAFDHIERGQMREYTSFLREKAGVTEDELPETINFDALHEVSRDVVAWICAPDTEINYVIAQTDNNRYYLENQLNGGYSMGGTLFVNCDNHSDLSDWNTVIYGHCMKNGSMFGSIRNYDSPEYYEKHPVMYLYTPGHRFRLELIAAYTTWLTDISYDIPKTVKGRDKIVANAKKQSMFQSDVTVGKGDKLVTLSTCMDDLQDKTYVVVGKLVEDKKSKVTVKEVTE